jgi:hypothetical protein
MGRSGWQTPSWSRGNSSNFFDGPINIPRIAQHMRLPAFCYAALDPYTWPPARK